MLAGVLGCIGWGGLFRIFQTSAPFATQITSFQQNIATFVTANPLVTLGGTIPYQEIENSETGNAYKIMGMVLTL
jgi:hypothetical protein